MANSNIYEANIYQPPVESNVVFLCAIYDNDVECWCCWKQNN